MAKLRSKTRPKFVRTDKLGQYNGPFNKVFYSNIPAKRVEHLQSEGFDSPTNINLIERFHGAIKQRTKVMRDLKRKYSARIIMDGFVTHYNFFMEHEYLDNSTPAQMGGIGGGISNWGDMIHRAQQHKRSNPVVELDWEAVSQID
jgi:transposase-like protein